MCEPSTGFIEDCVTDMEMCAADKVKFANGEFLRQNR